MQKIKGLGYLAQAKLEGKKTYLVAFITLVYAVVVVGMANNDWSSAFQLILAALGGASLRAGVSKEK